MRSLKSYYSLNITNIPKILKIFMLTRNNNETYLLKAQHFSVGRNHQGSNEYSLAQNKVVCLAFTQLQFGTKFNSRSQIALRHSLRNLYYPRPTSWFRDISTHLLPSVYPVFLIAYKKDLDFSARTIFFTQYTHRRGLRYALTKYYSGDQIKVNKMGRGM
jgi:hypothetical protein